MIKNNFLICFLAFPVLCSILIACNNGGEATTNGEDSLSIKIHAVKPAKDSIFLNSVAKTIAEQEGKDAEETIPATTGQKDTVSFWVYDYDRMMPVKNKKVKPEMLAPKKMIGFINSHNYGDKVHLDLLKISHDTIYVKIKESTYLTQQMGSSGADDFMSTTTFTLTELKGIKYVNYDFEEGDHASPGTYSRKQYTDRDAVNQLLNKKK